MSRLFEVEQQSDCESCKLYKTCKSPKMKYSGVGKKKILIVTEFPGKAEDEKGTQLIGKAEKILKKYLRKYDVDLDKDCWKINAVNCSPPDNRTPSLKEINLCRINLFQTIKEIQPEKIITLGKIALQSLVGEKISVTGIEKWIGWKIPDQDLNCWIFPNYHPRYLNYNLNDIVLENIFDVCLQEAVQWKKSFFKIEENIELITEPYSASIYLDSINNWNISPIAIDFETTGRKPQKEGHKILCISICDEKNKVTAFPIFEDKSFLIALKRVLKNNKIKKIAHNVKFETIWAKEILRCEIKNWEWDTMIAAHCLDNRTGITGLKFQTYTNFGIAEYDKEIEKFIKSENSNGFNMMVKAPLNKMLEYCAKDSLYTYNLYLKQKEELKLRKGFNLFLQGQTVFSKIEMQGICIDINYYIKQNKFLERKLEILNKKIMNSPEVLKWKGENFNFNSSQQLSKLLFEILKVKPKKQTRTGKNAVDQSVLESLNLPFVNKILMYKKYYKIKNTYLSQFIRETVNKKIHTSFNLNMVISYRSSSNSPNFQNIPKRDKRAQKITRKGIIPSKDNQLLEVDYSGIEVRISACYHKDPVMIDYINNPKTDMHRDMAEQIFMKKNISKTERYIAKNRFVFPQFYGSYYVECAKNIWDNSNELPFKSYQKFENHIKDIEYDFWNNRFKIYNQWRKETWEKFQKEGYIKFHTGFICTGYLKKNDVLNYSIQGTAFHCLLWSLIQLHNLLKNSKSKIIGQIHDSIIFDISPKELLDIKILIRKIMCEDIRKHWKWIIVPLDIEAEISEINGDWHNMKEEKL